MNLPSIKIIQVDENQDLIQDLALRHNTLEDLLKDRRKNHHKASPLSVHQVK
jgi:hypothetical protein